MVLSNGKAKNVSIPLKSGLFVIGKQGIYKRVKEGLNPLKIGSVCNKVFKMIREVKDVSIPLKSGLFVIN